MELRSLLTGHLAGAAHGLAVVTEDRPDLPGDVAAWPEDWRHAYEERAAIMEYDGNMDRDEAERSAEADVRLCYERSGT